MKRIRGKDLRELGFKKEVENPTLDPEDSGYHYYVYDIDANCLLMSNSSDERVKGGYVVEFYEHGTITFRSLKKLKSLMKLLKSSKNAR